MSPWRITGSLAFLAAVSIGAARAQTPELEPGVQTSAPAAAPAPVAAPAPAVLPAPAAATAAKVPAAGSKPGTGSTSGAAVPQAGATGSKSQDRIQLDTTQISGNRELPKVMYVVPWRKADLGEFAGKPPNSLLDEALTPVDRDVFRRQNRYYSALGAGAADAKSQPESKVEK